MRLFLQYIGCFLIIIMVTMCSQKRAQSASVRLQWDTNPATFDNGTAMRVNRYRVYTSLTGTTFHKYTTQPQVNYTSHQRATVSELNTNVSYWFVITALNIYDQESSYSNIVELLAPWENGHTIPVPRKYRIINRRPS